MFQSICNWTSIIGIDGRTGRNEIKNNSKLDAMKNVHLSMVANFYSPSTWNTEARGLPLLTAEGDSWKKGKLAGILVGSLTIVVVVARWSPQHSLLNQMHTSKRKGKNKFKILGLWIKKNFFYFFWTEDLKFSFKTLCKFPNSPCQVLSVV